ncbi:TPA: nucleoid-associated protein [Pasteurella multocida]|uniref:nucleoid-associated protein n=1 Tax=Pasteurella multocida TaxID=747 RepID=UPI002B5DD84E|nr:nucleoid-associated protein [Pasteurella multocida]MEB3467302.1 nucleoid-associated protein [Pasteurella multocida]MEB3498123.1 nucleoid-associated protein [Pasteurella multocida]HDR0626473.1 nucleoid-associated protein [Pasteurella multocida]HDR1188703.1 nucleoid-associated protein [Pasteurella multocida]HDR1432419.1 nucleoid-associated protein [Pasteurella multocida]
MVTTQLIEQSVTPAFTIHAGIIHQIKKTQHKKNGQLIKRSQLHTNNNPLKHFVEYAENVLNKYGSNRSTSGGFTTKDTLSKGLVTHKFALQPTTDYLVLSQDIVASLYNIIQNNSATTGEHIPMIFYRDDNKDKEYLLLSLISLNQSINIDNGEFIDTTMIDKDALKVGIRIDLKAMKYHFEHQTEAVDEPYIQWIERKKNKLPDYIQNFVPVSEKINDKVATTQFIEAFKSFSEQTFENEDVRYEIQKKVYDYLDECHKQGKSVHIEDDIDPIIEAEMKVKGLESKPTFSDYRATEKIQLDSRFSPNKEVVNNSKTFKFSSKTNEFTIRGRSKDLGRRVKLVSEINKKYIKIELDESDYCRFKKQYPNAEESEQ